MALCPTASVVHHDRNVKSARLGATPVSSFLALGPLPQGVHFVEGRTGGHAAALGEQRLDAAKAALELGVGAAQRGLGIDAGVAPQIDAREQQIPELLGDALGGGAGVQLGA